ncbi:MAG: hypothetical protein R6V50_01645 [Thermoplasmatota archaeon]
MKRKKNLRKIIDNQNAVSEEFTTLPSITIILVGFALFILLIANTYSAYESRIESIQKYQTANFIATKLTNSDCQFIQEAGSVRYNLFTIFDTTDQWDILQEEYKKSAIGFRILLSWDEGSYELNPSDYNSLLTGDRVAVSREVSIQLNHARTIPGKLTIITWSVE